MIGDITIQSVAPDDQEIESISAHVETVLQVQALWKTTLRAFPFPTTERLVALVSDLMEIEYVGRLATKMNPSSGPVRWRRSMVSVTLGTGSVGNLTRCATGADISI